jgi:alpha-amylase/alpha-mannosidase (GH57 family)
VDVYPGAWNTEHQWGGDFTQWTGSLLQKRGFGELKDASGYYHRTKRRYDHLHERVAEAEVARELIHQAYDRLLVAETSCNFYWGSSWVHRAFDDLEQCYCRLDKANQILDSGEPAGTREPSRA